jgi:hypothetical protein
MGLASGIAARFSDHDEPSEPLANEVELPDLRRAVALVAPTGLGVTRAERRSIDGADLAAFAPADPKGSAGGTVDVFLDHGKPAEYLTNEVELAWHG